MNSIARAVETTQVNLRQLAWQTAMPPAQAAQWLRFDPCFNIVTARALVRICLDEARGGLLHGAGYHHPHHPPLADACRQRAIASGMRCFGGNTAR